MNIFYCISEYTVKNNDTAKKHFEEIKFSIGFQQFSMDCCPKLTGNYNFGLNPDNKILKILDDKLTKSVRHFEENKFLIGFHQFLMDC